MYMLDHELVIVSNLQYNNPNWISNKMTETRWKEWREKQSNSSIDEALFIINICRINFKYITSY